MKEHDFNLRFALNRRNSGQRSIAPLTSRASAKIDRQPGMTQLIRYTLSASVELIDGKNWEAIKKEDLWEG